MRVMVGGTFDPLHIGHQQLLTQAFTKAGTNGTVFIGLTTDTFASRKTHPVRPYTIRKGELETWIHTQHFAAEYRIDPLNDPFGHALDTEFDILAVSYETEETGNLINRKRKEAGLRAVELCRIDCVTAEDGDAVSSTRIYRGEINRYGKPEPEEQFCSRTASSLAWFTDLTCIPRPSGNLTAIRNYLIQFAEKHHLPYETDTAGNVLIHHPGTTQKHLILQAHMDMVAAVREGSAFDFTKDAIETYTADGWLYAKETSLGADDGAGMAIILSALTAPELEQTGFDALFTADEESDMNGAKHISPSWLKADALINIDSEDWGEACISCAGGGLLETVFPFNPVNEPAQTAYTLIVSGLLSGHSGIMIDKGRLNAIRTAAQFLSTLHNVRLAEINGGTVFNAIPAEAAFTFTASDTDIPKLAEQFCKEHARETDPGLKLEIKPAGEHTLLTGNATKALLTALTEVPDGCLEKDTYGPVLSSNLGIVRTENGKITVTCFVRSNSDEKRDTQIIRMKSILETYGGVTRIKDTFPGWTASPQNPLLSAVKEVYRNMTGSEIKVVSTHGGLEGGIFAAVNPLLPMVSVGPTIENPHTIDERLHLSTFAKTTEFIFALLQNYSAKTDTPLHH